MRYTKIHTQIWNDEKFIRLTPEQQRLFLYILTSPHSNIIGFYVLKKNYMQGDLEVLPKDLAKDLSKLCSEGLISYDEDLQVVLIHNWLKHNPVTNPNQRLAAVKIILEMPKTELFNNFKVLCEGLNEALSEAIPKSLPKPCHPEEETEEETETETEDPTSNGSRNGIVPYEQIKKLWNEIASNSELLEIDGLDKTRKSHIKARWNYNDNTKSLEWWKKFFDFITESDFLMGRVVPPPGKKTFIADFDWVINSSNFLKIKEGKYHRQ